MLTAQWTANCLSNHVGIGSSSHVFGDVRLS